MTAEPTDRIKSETFEDQVSNAYLDYAMSVITSRALPDVRDGLKPVHRRIIYAAHENGFTASSPFKKSARIVGDVIGKYHPHGDQSVYDAMVRLAQPWAQRSVLIDGQGNFGSVDNDPPAAMRYTEARLSRLAMTLLEDIDRGTVSFRPNYDGSEREPTVLPAAFPNLLVNGQAGIAVGMATLIPTHNLVEAIEACLVVIDKPEATLDDVMAVMPGPDFPTSGVIMGRAGIRKAYETGRGSFVISGVASFEKGTRGREKIVITELPYACVKAKLIEHIAELVNDKKIEGVSDINDESDKECPIRIVIDLKADADPAVVLNGIKKFTAFQSTFGYNATCLDSRGKPVEMGVMQMLREFVAFRRLVIQKRTQFDLDKARFQQTKQIGLYAALSLLDLVVASIRSSSDADEARVKLMAMSFPCDADLSRMIRESDPDAEPGETFMLSDVQADAILALTLRQLTGLERDKIVARASELAAEIRGLLDILIDANRLSAVMRDELVVIRDKNRDPRRTRIESAEADDIDDDALVERKDVVVTLTKSGYVKRTEVATYREQKRGGKGRIGMETKDDDYVALTLVCTTRTPLLAFTSAGQARAIKTHRLPEAAANAKGRPIINFVPLQPGETITSLVPLPEDRADYEHMNLVFITDFGTIRRNRVTDFLDMNKNGKIAMKLEGDDGAVVGKMVDVLLADDHDDVMVSTANGMCLRSPVSEVRVFVGRDSRGVRSIDLKNDDIVVSACVLPHSELNTVERDVYLAGGVKAFVPTDLQNAKGERREIPATVTFEPSPTEEKPDRLMAKLDPVRMLEMQVQEKFFLTVSQNGFGKRSSSYEYRTTGRGGSGLTAAEINKQTGQMVACMPVEEADGLVLVTDGGQTIRTRISDVSRQGRASRGVRLLSVPDGQKIVGVARIATDIDDETDEEQPS